MVKQTKSPGICAPAVCAAGVALAAAALLIFPEAVREAAKNSVVYCLTALVPSLFPFMVLVSFTAGSGAGDALGRVLAPLCRLFRLPSACAAPVLMGFIGGYPAGAKGASLLLEQGKIDGEQAGRMMLFCMGPGPAFAVTFLGGTVLHSFRAGWVLFFSVTLSGLLLGVIAGLGAPKPQKKPAANAAPAESALIRAVSDASGSVVKMCACILLFSAVTAVLRASGVFDALCRLLAQASPLTPPEAAAALSFLVEVTGGVGDASRLQAGPVLYSFGLAFGGLCVHLQAFSFFEEFPVKKRKFFLFRFLHGVLSALLTALFIHFLPGDPVEALASGAIREVSPLSGTLAGGLSLLLMCLAFLLIAGKGGFTAPPAGKEAPRRPDTAPGSQSTPPSKWSSTRRRRSLRRSA